MKVDKASRTAQYMALFRALETTRNPGDRLFTDHYAISFLDNGLKLAVKTSRFPAVRKFIIRTIQKKIPGALSSGIARTKYIDNLLQKTIADGVKQVMILGAGFDARALRLEFLKSIPVIEIDHPNTSDYKINILRKKFRKLPGNITYCQIDFNKQSLDELAIQNNFDFSKSTTIIWEGVSNYLTREAVDKTFSFFSRFPENSYIIFTYVHKQVLYEPVAFFGGEKLLKDLEKIEESWTFGFLPEQLPYYLKTFGLMLLEDLGADEYRNKYLSARNEKGYEFYRVAIAKK